MTIFEYLYGDVYYTDEYGNAYFDSCVDIDYELDEIPEIVNLGDHTYFMAKEDLDLYNQYDIKVDGISEDDLRFLHYTRRPYYQMRGRSVSREQAFDIIRRTDNFFNWDMETIGNRKEFVRCINFDNWLIMKNHYPKGYGWHSRGQCDHSEVANAEGVCRRMVLQVKSIPLSGPGNRDHKLG